MSRKLFTHAAIVSAVLCLIAAAAWLYADCTGRNLYYSTSGPQEPNFTPPPAPGTVTTFGRRYTLDDRGFTAAEVKMHWGPHEGTGDVVVVWRIPWWLVVVGAAGLPVCWVSAARWRWLPRLRTLTPRGRRRELGLCPVCGYDLRATPDRCPECGNNEAPPRRVSVAPPNPARRDVR